MENFKEMGVGDLAIGWQEVDEGVVADIFSDAENLVTTDYGNMCCTSATHPVHGRIEIVSTILGNLIFKHC